MPDAPKKPSTATSSKAPDSVSTDVVAPEELAAERESSPTTVPDRAHVVIVPLANPSTAPDLLKIARAVVRGDGGRVIGVSIAIGDADAEQAVERMELLEGIVREVDEDIEVLRRSASTIGRGILDAAREVGADMMVLGLTNVDGHVELGRVVQSVVNAATIDVLLYRPGTGTTDLEQLDRVIVGVDDSEPARAAARVGIILGHGFDRPIDAVTVRGSSQPPADAWAMLDRGLEGVEDQGDCRRRVIKATSVAAGLTRTADHDDLLVIGFHERSTLNEWLDGDAISRILDGAAGPTIAVSRRVEPVRAKRRAMVVVDWLRPKLTDVEKETIDWRSQSQAKTSLDYMTLIVVAAVLASLGLLLNSPAVIIGAMLVAPLMGPLVAFAIALRVARLTVVRQALATVLVGTATTFGVSVLIGALVPLAEPTSEMLARGSPSYLDAGVAIASGLVGAYATARKDIPAALAGVAIAAALVPPICASGLALGLGEAGLARGAFLLFTVNVLCIAAIGTGVFAWLGLTPREDANPAQRHISVMGALIVPFLVFGLLASGAGRFQIARGDLALAVQEVLDLEVHAVEVLDGQRPALLLTVRGEEPPASGQVERLRDRLREDLREPDLDLEVAFTLTIGTGSLADG